MRNNPKKFIHTFAMFRRGYLPYCTECGRCMRNYTVSMSNGTGKWMHQSCHKRLLPAKKPAKKGAKK